jgi:hypothetical protein
MYLLDDMWQHMSYHIGQFDQNLKQNPRFSEILIYFPIGFFFIKLFFH